MNVSIAFVEDGQQIWHKLDLMDGCTIKQAIEISGLLEQFPNINLKERKVGIHGKVAELSDEIKEGDRIEIYRPITADPTTVKRRPIVAQGD